MKKMTIVFFIAVLVSSVSAGSVGSTGAMEQSAFTLEEMLQYGLEDEHIAKGEYEAIIDRFDVSRPYSNIVRSEQQHIEYLIDLYEAYNIPVPSIDVSELIYIPASLSEAAEIGVKAEIANIAMYEKFLEQDLPDDVEETFLLLKKASENHLRAFENQLTGRQGRR